MNIVKQKNRHRENGGSFLGVFSFEDGELRTQWFIDILFITRDSRMSNKLCGRKTTKQNDFTL